MAIYNVQQRGDLTEGTGTELDQLSATLRKFLLAEHNEDGTHRFNLGSNDRPTTTIDQIVDRYQQYGQWWLRGPFILDDPTAAEPDEALIDPLVITATPQHNYAPRQIDTAVGMEIEGTVDVTFTGFKVIEGKNKKRLLWVHNRSATTT